MAGTGRRGAARRAPFASRTASGTRHGNGAAGRQGRALAASKEAPLPNSFGAWAEGPENATRAHERPPNPLTVAQRRHTPESAESHPTDGTDTLSVRRPPGPPAASRPAPSRCVPPRRPASPTFGPLTCPVSLTGGHCDGHPDEMAPGRRSRLAAPVPPARVQRRARRRRAGRAGARAPGIAPCRRYLTNRPGMQRRLPPGLDCMYSTNN